MKLRSWLHRSFHLHEQQRLERESAERVHLALHARSLKAALSPLVGVIVALGTGFVLWYGGALVVGGILSAGSLVVFIWYLGKLSPNFEEALAGRKPQSECGCRGFKQTEVNEVKRDEAECAKL